MKYKGLTLLIILFFAFAQGVEAKCSRLNYLIRGFDQRFRKQVIITEYGFACKTVYGAGISEFSRSFYVEKGVYDTKLAREIEREKVAKSKKKPHNKLTRRDYEKQNRQNKKKSKKSKRG